MKVIPSLLVPFLLVACAGMALRADPDSYVPGPDSLPQAGVPKGELIKFEFAESKVFPGTTRKVTVYVPRQYNPAKPACVYISQDGVQWSAPVVFDNLIAKGDIPVLIGVFVTPGIVAAKDPKAALSRYNRSLEYDGLGDDFAHLLLDEVLPVVETKVTSDGRPIHLSHSGNDRAIGGGSSGAIAAFNAAWEHPEAFSRVVSSVGTFIGLRGADRYPILVRKYEPKPIRVFLQDGSHDLNIYAGDWWMANQTMERALTFSGYEVNHVWGDGSHNGKHITAEFPDALRWIWKDWPKAVGNGPTQNAALKALLVAGEGWKATAEPPAEPKTPYVTDGGAVWKIAADGTRSAVETGLNAATAVTLCPDHTLLYVAEGSSHWIYSYQVQADGKLAYGQRYFWLHTDDLDNESHAAAMCCDNSGWLYVATVLGVQVCDQAGRVNAILPLPGKCATSVYFSGEKRDTLYAGCDGTVYSRRLATVGVDPNGPVVRPPEPHL
jgi:enterochelin esterase-like enzyme